MTVSDVGAAVLASSYAIVMIFGSISNAIVAMTYFKWYRTMLSHPKDILILSLAIGDFFMSALVCPLGFAAAVTKEWTSGRTGCVWYGFFSTWVGLASITQLAVLAVERYITLSNPTPNVISPRRAFQAVLASWAFAFIASCFPLVGWSEYTFEGFGLHCSILWESKTVSNASYCMFLLVFFFVLPVSAIGFSYARIFFIVRRIYLNADTMWGADAQATKESYESQLKTAKQLLLIITGFMFAWTPYAVMSTAIVLFGTSIPHGYHEYPSLFAKTSNIYNPVIYFFTYQNLREKAIQMLRGFSNNRVHPQSSFQSRSDRAISGQTHA